MNPTQQQHGILCGVTSCEYQQGGGCTLDNISVQPCTNDATSEKKEDQSMCSSYSPTH